MRGITLVQLAALLMSTLSVRPARAQAHRFLGVWRGVQHSENRDEAIALIFSPRGLSGIAGEFYYDGDDFGAADNPRIAGDSLTFHVGSLDFFTRLTGPSQLAVHLVVGPGKIHDFELALASPDTAAGPGEAGRRVGAPPLQRDQVPDSLRAARHAAPSHVSSTAPCLDRGTLILIGGGSNEDEFLKRFVHLAGGASASIVVVPTAGVRTGDSTELAGLGANVARILGVPNVTVLHTVSRAEANSGRFVEPLRHATGVWILGGEASYLLDAYMGTRTETELITLLGRGGVIGGTSAGALIWGSQALLYHSHPGGPAYQIEKPEDLVIGNVQETMLGLLRDVLIAPHFKQFKSASSMDRILSAYPGLLGIGIDEATAIEVHASQFVVLGRGAVSVYDGLHSRGAPLVLMHGSRYDLANRAAL